MARARYGILFSFLFIFSIFPPAMAAESHEAVAKKMSYKKQGATKRSHHAALKRSSKRGKQKAVISASVNSREKSAGRVKVSLNQGRSKTVYQRVAYTSRMGLVSPSMTVGDLAGLNLTRDPLALKSNAALVMDQNTFEVLFEKNANIALPIASITKLMTGLVVLESNQSMDEVLTVTDEDVDREKFSHSRLRLGSRLTRANMLHIALMSSENRAASALGRNYPGGLPAFVAAMNAKAKSLGMDNTRYVDSTGLSSNNISTAHDLAKLVIAAYQHPLIREYSTDSQYAVEPGGTTLHYKNSNHLVMNPQWEIGLQKTGYISEAGRCLVMQAKIEGRPVVMVFLDSKGKEARSADAGRIRKWLETMRPSAMARTLAPQS